MNGEVIYPYSADMNATKLLPSSREKLPLVGAASMQPMETAHVVLLFVSAMFMISRRL